MEDQFAFLYFEKIKRNEKRNPLAKEALLPQRMAIIKDINNPEIGWLNLLYIKFKIFMRTTLPKKKRRQQQQQTNILMSNT